MKKHIPNIITLLNLFCGLIALTIANNTQQTFVVLCWVLLAIVFDFFDGFTARMLKVNSLLGLQLDSLADMVTSGVVPGFMMYQYLTVSRFYYAPDLLSENGYATLAFSGFFITLASGYRLAKFNIDTRQTSGFIGLPTPANTILVLSLLWMSSQYKWIASTEFLLALTLISSWLLNAEIPLFALKFKTFSWTENKLRYLFLVISTLILLLLKFEALPVIIVLYVMLSMISQKR